MNELPVDGQRIAVELTNVPQQPSGTKSGQRIRPVKREILIGEGHAQLRKHAVRREARIIRDPPVDLADCATRLATIGAATRYTFGIEAR